MSAPCVTCRAVLSRLDLADGLRCEECDVRAYDSPPRTGFTAAALLLAALFTLGFVGLVLVGQGVVCDLRDDRISYCEAQR